MAETKAITIEQLRTRPDIPPEALDRIESMAVRLIQIRADIKALEEEQGYTDRYEKDENGKYIRHRGVSDKLQELCIELGLTDYNIRFPEFLVMPDVPGNSSHIDPILLANLGVPGDVIAAATVTSRWTSCQVRKNKPRKTGVPVAEQLRQAGLTPTGRVSMPTLQNFPIPAPSSNEPTTPYVEYVGAAAREQADLGATGEPTDQTPAPKRKRAPRKKK